MVDIKSAWIVEALVFVKYFVRRRQKNLLAIHFYHENSLSFTQYIRINVFAGTCFLLAVSMLCLKFIY